MQAFSAPYRAMESTATSEESNCTHCDLGESMHARSRASDAAPHNMRYEGGDSGKCSLCARCQEWNAFRMMARTRVGPVPSYQIQGAVHCSIVARARGLTYSKHFQSTVLTQTLFSATIHCAELS
jgi:hypothetical protein